MTELPRHPNVGDDDRHHTDRSGSKRPWWSYALLVLVVALVVLMVVLHLTGVVGPGFH